MEPASAAADHPGDGGDERGRAAETVAAVFRALESVEGDVSPQLARAVQATINAVKQIEREFGLLTERDVRDALGSGMVSEALGFVLHYRGQDLYPGFLFEPLPTAGGTKRVRPLMKDLKKVADKYGLDGTDVVLWMTSPTTWFADERRPVDHLDEPARIIAALEDEAGIQW